jgi:pyruvate dehydrogenase E2 component (dihydrolipoamide acetyltransferase)
MATAIIMPRQGQSVESCIIAKWYKKKGDQVQSGELLFSYESDKASFDEEAKASGILLDIFFEEGDDVPCLTNVCVIGNEGESTAEFNPNAQAAETAVINEEKQQQQIELVVDKEAVPVPVPFEDGDRLKISPRAKKLAEKTGINYRFASPSGPYGRIVEKDIITLRESGPVMTPAARDTYQNAETVRSIQGTGIGGRITTDDLNKKSVPAESAVQVEGPMFEEVKIPNIRKVIGKAMYHSISSTAQLTLNTSFDVTEIMKFRKKLKEGKDRLGLENITMNDIILYVASRTLQNHKELNANFQDDMMLYFKNVNLGVAVDTERGLMVPNVFNANLKSLNEISREVKKLIKDCQSGTINPDTMKGGSFTITNLGTLDIESFTPILNAPQTGILGVCSIVQRAREVDGEYEFYPAMGLSLTFDHRALDGAPAARFLKELKDNLENFSIMLAK